MPINTKQLIELIIRPTLKSLDLWSLEAEMLLAGTAAQESGMGTYIKQVGGGPALSPWMIEPEAHDDIWNNFLCSRSDLRQRVKLACYLPSNPDNYLYYSGLMIGNIAYACAMARIHYLRVKEPLPRTNDLHAMAAYYKKHYNTPNGAATEQQFIDNFNRYVKPYYQDKI